MTTFCRNCNMSVEADESPLADVICPRCGVVVRSAPTSRSAARETVGWQTTSFAVKTQFGILVTFLIGTAAAFVLRPPLAGDGSAAFCMAILLLLGYFIALCLCASAPNPAVRRSALACVLTLVLGSLGLIAMPMILGPPNDFRLPLFLLESVFGFGAFAVYFSAFVFLMRFHATIARFFGNRRLRRQCHVYTFAAVVAAGVNFVFFWFAEPFFPPRRPLPLFIPNDLAMVVQPTFNFVVVAWYAMILLRTFRTIDRGPVVEPRDSRRTEMDDDDLSID